MSISAHYALPAQPSPRVSVAELASYFRRGGLQKCLKEVYKLDNDLCMQKLHPLFDINLPQSLIDDFLALSDTVVLTIPTEQKLRALGEWDAVLQAPLAHRVLFENDTLRILDASVQPGESVPFHTHQWDSIMIILQGSRFLIEDRAGNLSEGEWESSVEKFEGSFTLESYTNIGPQAFRAIAFEIKK